MKEVEFNIICEIKNRNVEAEFDRICNDIKKYFTNDDLSIETAHIIARKPY